MYKSDTSLRLNYCSQCTRVHLWTCNHIFEMIFLTLSRRLKIPHRQYFNFGGFYLPVFVALFAHVKNLMVRISHHEGASVWLWSIWRQHSVYEKCNSFHRSPATSPSIYHVDSIACFMKCDDHRGGGKGFLRNFNADFPRLLRVQFS